MEPGRGSRARRCRWGGCARNLDDPDPDQRVLDAVEAIAGTVDAGRQELTASQLAERLGFAPARQRTPVGDLSGGERRRLQLTRVLMGEPNVLLHEPGLVPDLDIDTLQQVEDLLDGWAGTLVVIISHDRYLIERICDSTWGLFGDGKLTNYLGASSREYLERRSAALRADRRCGQPSPPRRLLHLSAPTSARPSTVMPARRWADFERQIDKPVRTRRRSHAGGRRHQLVEAATDPGRLVELDAELKRVVADKEQAEADWLVAAELAD